MDNNVCFKPFSPVLESGLNIVWKKHQVFYLFLIGEEKFESFS